ncbi:MAG: sigma-54-dependent Fis family transcriptional regulator, partial [Candidatus Aminicenantes bacterium]
MKTKMSHKDTQRGTKKKSFSYKLVRVSSCNFVAKNKKINHRVHRGKIIPGTEKSFPGQEKSFLEMFEPGEGFYRSYTKKVNVPADMIDRVKKDDADVGGITGKSEKMKQIRQLVLNYSKENEPVLLLGETGVGKNHTAELIHRHSGREGRFVVASAPNLQEGLFECTLFGHKKGAFTDAKSDRQGLVEEARAGTLFIDEISGVPVSIQARLLRFIESKKYRVLGESFEREANVRIIAASNKDLVKAIENKEFREDLYYRLNVLEIMIPPLRDRKEDIQDFVRHKQTYLKGKEIGPGFMEALYNHEWPGNIRELITVLKRAGICCKSP